MSSYQFPGGPAVGAQEAARMLAAGSSDRRAFFKRAAGLGLAMPVLGGLGLHAQTADAQDEHGHELEGTPESGYVGSDPQSPSTGDESPVPTEVQPFTRLRPGSGAGGGGAEGDHRRRQRRVPLHRQGRAVRGLDLRWHGAGTGIAGGGRGRDRFHPGQIDPNATTAHSLDFHSAQTPPEVNYKTILPGEEFSWSFTPRYPGAFMYHCGTPPVLMHIGTGMYGAMIVDPKDGWSEAQELVFVQSDFYLMDGENGIKVPDYTKMLGHGNMDYVVFNGYATSTSTSRSW